MHLNPCIQHTSILFNSFDQTTNFLQKHIKIQKETTLSNVRIEAFKYNINTKEQIITFGKKTQPYYITSTIWNPNTELTSQIKWSTNLSDWYPYLTEIYMLSNITWDGNYFYVLGRDKDDINIKNKKIKIVFFILRK